MLSTIVKNAIGKESFTVGARAGYTLPYRVMCQAIAIYYSSVCAHGIAQAKRLHVFELLYFVGQHERQCIMYSLDLCVSCSTYLAIFMAHECSREALNFHRITS